MKRFAALVATAVVLTSAPALAHVPGSWLMPVRLSAPSAAPVKSGFGPRWHAGEKRSIAHHGVDYASALGTPVRAAGAGKVLYTGWYGGYGKVVIVDHGQDVTTLVAHLGSIDVKEGQRVKTGQRLGAAGATGMTTGPVTHFEVRKGGNAVDPVPYLR